MKEIKYLSLKDLNAPYEQDIQHAISEVVSSGWYLQGKRIHDFEEHYAAYIRPPLHQLRQRTRCPETDVAGRDDSGQNAAW